MFKKIIFKTLIFCFALVSIAQSSESGGMPQLNPEFWVSQIFWLILTFGTMFVVLSKLILPKISKNLEKRKSQILENIETAEKQRELSENKIKEYEKLSLPTIHKEVLESWIAADVFAQSIKAKKLNPTFTFYEGPPSANGMPGIHHVIARTLKDIFCCSLST